ncbi:hypothetical protein BD779DRAFT_1808778 [Infundibulicybe gibba]|nr:hypothetical protein BD779DRAFT_1808778 [Infundibulicybe gibba]
MVACACRHKSLSQISTHFFLSEVGFTRPYNSSSRAMFGIPPVFCLSVASATLLVYDVLCTVDQEIAYVWFAPWTPLKFLFFLNRYIPFVGIFMGIHSTSNSSLNLCFYANIPASDEGDLYSRGVRRQLPSSHLVLDSLRSVLILRTYILWDRKRWVLILLSALLISTLAAGFVFTQMDIESMKFIPFPVGLDMTGCNIEYSKNAHRVPMTYAFVLIAETVIMVLTVSRAFRHLRQTHSSWIFELYKSGCLFYICLFVLSLTNLLLPVFAPDFKNLLGTLQIVLHSIFSTRVLLLVLSQRKRRSELGPQDCAKVDLSSLLGRYLQPSWIHLMCQTHMMVCRTMAAIGADGPTVEY